MTSDEDMLAVFRQAFDSARSGDEQWLRAFLDAGGSADLTNDKGDTLLILAAYHAQENLVGTLIDSGADVDHVNDNGQTALAAAVFRRSRTSVEVLLAAGANPDTGARSAHAIAEFFALDDMKALLAEPR